jgi:erythromycin esterase
VNKDGRPLTDATIRSLRSGARPGEIFLGKSDERGFFELTVPKGKYTVALEAANVGADSKVVEGSGKITVEFDLQSKFPPDAHPPREIDEWLRANAIPLSTTEAGHGFADLQPLKKVIGSARVVALGEATHGTRQFFQLKHRMLEFLANEMGFTLFAIEASYPEALAVNDYVLSGKGSASDSLASMQFWIWDTAEVLDLIEWMHRYNEDPRHLTKLQFYGFDMQSPPGAVQRALEYLEKVDIERMRRIAPAVAPLDNDFDAQNYVQLAQSRAATCTDAIAQMIKRLDEEKDTYIHRSSLGEWTQARMNARVAAEGDEMLRSTDFSSRFSIRDRSMAENIRSLLDQQPAQARLVAWAHNGHVRKGPSFGNSFAMGGHLTKALGADLVVFGFAFNQGSFQAFKIPSGGLTRFTVPPMSPGSLDASLARAGKLFAIDLRTAPRHGPVDDWLMSRLVHREIGAVFSYEAAEGFNRDFVPGREFDALFFVEETSSARPNYLPSQSSTPPGTVVKEKAGTASNLNFERSGTDGTPAGWLAFTGPERSRYLVSTDESNPFRGKRCASIRRNTAPWRWGYGALFQNIEAERYRGRRIRFRAAARAEIAGIGNRSELFVAAFPAHASTSTKALAFATTMDSPVLSSDWKQYQVEAFVPPQADSIQFGFILAGNGRAWFDDASLEVAEESTATQ